jgi:hypothetical protein
MNRAARAAYWFAPPLFCVALYWTCLYVWFQQDDFAWLGLGALLHDEGGWLATLFAPMAQGTIRTLSERLFFLSLSGLFGIEALPFHICAMATQVANLALLMAILLRVSGSRLAAFCAPLLWTLNAVLVTPMSWASAYNQILCAFFLLLSFYFWVRFLETERRGFLVCQWATFLLGFGALEVNVVYPALAVGYALLRSPRQMRKTIPMFGVSAAFLALHFLVIPKNSTGTYALHFDSGMLRTLAEYWQLALGIGRTSTVVALPNWLGLAGTALLSAALLWFAVWCFWRKRWLPLFFLAWFLIVLAPVLPLRGHVSEYYLLTPVAGLSAFMALGLDAAWSRSRFYGAAATILALLFAAGNWPLIRLETAWWRTHSNAVRRLVLGVAEARRLHPSKTILLTGVSSDLFWFGVLDNPFRLYGVKQVFLAPGSEKSIERHPDLGDVDASVLPQKAAFEAIQNSAAVVYDASGATLKNVTDSVTRRALIEWSPEIPRRIEPGLAAYDKFLGPEWYGPETTFRWMPKRATLTLAGPRTHRERLFLSVACPSGSLAQGPVTLRVSAEGQEIGTAAIDRAGAPVSLTFGLPPKLLGVDKITVALEVQRSSRIAGDPRDFGLAVSLVEIR